MNKKIYFNNSNSETLSIDRIFLNLLLVVVFNYAFVSFKTYLESHLARAVITGLLYFCLAIYGFIRVNNLLPAFNPYLLLTKEKIEFKEKFWSSTLSIKTSEVSSISLANDFLIINLNSGTHSKINLGWIPAKLVSEIKKALFEWSKENSIRIEG